MFHQKIQSDHHKNIAFLITNKYECEWKVLKLNFKNQNSYFHKNSY